MGTVHALLTRGQNRGTNGSLGTPKYHYKREGKVAKKAEIGEVKMLLIKFCKRRENSGKVNITSRYPIKATIAHTRIQKESNFASLEGWNSHPRL